MVSQSRPYLYAHRTAQKRQPPERLAIPVLRVHVQGSEIVITASDSDYMMTYHKPANSPRLLAKSFPRKEDRRVSMTLAGFLTAAYKLANDRAGAGLDRVVRTLRYYALKQSNPTPAPYRLPPAKLGQGNRNSRVACPSRSVEVGPRACGRRSGRLL